MYKIKIHLCPVILILKGLSPKFREMALVNSNKREIEFVDINKRKTSGGGGAIKKSGNSFELNQPILQN